MAKGIIGRKVGMTYLFNEDGTGTPATVIEAGPCVVVQRKTVEKDGYEALQLGFERVFMKRPRHNRKPRRERMTRPLRGHCRKGVEAWRRDHAGGGADGREDLRRLAGWRVLREVAVSKDAEPGVGQEIRADIFRVGERVNVAGTSKGRGFAGVIRRWGFHGHGASHGAKIHRKPASSGGTDAARVFPGKKSPGHLGAVRTTVQNLEVLQVDAEHNLLVVKGAVPGPKGGLLMITSPRKEAEDA